MSTNREGSTAWIRFQRMRVEVLAHDFELTEAEFVLLLRLSNSPEHRFRERDMAAALHWERGRL